MKNFKNVLVIVSTCLVPITCCNNSLAKDYNHDWKSNLYVGLDVLQTNYSTQENYGRNIFYKNPLALNAFVGYKLPRNFFVEAGYETTGIKKRSRSGIRYCDLPGVRSPAVFTYLVNTKIKIENPSIGFGINYNLPRFEKTSISGLIGISFTKIKAEMNFIRIGSNNTRTNYFTKRKITPTLTASLNHDFTNNLRIRLNLIWHNLKKFEIVDNSNRIFKIKMKDAYIVGFGATYSFF